MPRYADHDERREELADTVRELILEHGIDRVSVRNVAQKSGWSVGAIRYYFPRQDDLLVYVLNRSIEQTRSRILSAEAEHPDDPRKRVLDMLHALTPINETNRITLRIWIAFLDRALYHQESANLLEQIFLHHRHYSRRMVAALGNISPPQEIEDVFDDPYLEDVAAILHTMWDGMSLQGMMAPKVMSSEGIEQVSSRLINTIIERVTQHLERKGVV
jgi:AcrR family transcriptional regulator